MSKKSLKRTDQRMIIKIAVFGFLTVASVGLFLFGMVNNSNGSVERFERLKAVDAAGGDVEAALIELRDYIHSHMNTEIGGPNGIYPPIQLSGQIIGRADCNGAYIEENSVSVTPIDDAFYKFNYVAPRWSPDLAGFSLLAAFVFGSTTIIYAIRHFHIRHLIRLGN